MNTISSIRLPRFVNILLPVPMYGDVAAGSGDSANALESPDTTATMEVERVKLEAVGSVRRFRAAERIGLSGAFRGCGTQVPAAQIQERQE